MAFCGTPARPPRRSVTTQETRLSLTAPRGQTKTAGRGGTQGLPQGAIPALSNSNVQLIGRPSGNPARTSPRPSGILERGFRWGNEKKI